jgi:hypothetical protein
MSKGMIKIGISGFESEVTAFDRTFSIKRIRISRKDRTADGTLVEDVIARKLEFTLAYNTLDEEDLWNFESLFNTNYPLSIIIYTDDVTYDQYDVLMRPFDQSRLLLYGSEAGHSVWQGLTFTFEEI